MNRKTYNQMRTMAGGKGDIKSLRPMLRYLKPYKLYAICAIIALLITSVSVLGMGKGVGYLVDKGLGQNDSGLLNTALLSLLGITVMLALGTYARFFFVTYTGERVVADIRRDIYSHILSLSPEYFERTKSGDILSCITNDTSLLQMVVGSSVSVALRNALMFFGGVLLLLHTSPKLTMIVAIVVPLVVLPIIILGKKLRLLSRESQERVSYLSSHAEESINGIKTIQAFVREGLESSVFTKLVGDSLYTATKRIRLRSMLTAIVIMFVFGAVAFVLWIGGNDVISGRMSAGELSSFVFYSIVVAGATGAISEVIGDLQRAAGASERILDLLDTDSAVKDSEETIPMHQNVKGDIEFNNVEFVYPANINKIALNGFNLDIKSGETIALVGPSGAGKSTIFQLLLRFYEIKSGSITIDGNDIRKYRLRDLRNLFGLVPQDPVIFSGTAYENILFGNPDASAEQVREAARAASAFGFINKLPEGFDTFLGEKGVRLSGGERQRIAIARVFLKNPQIVLLDEATSALDAENEQNVKEAFEKLMENRTTIVIAHRLSTVKKADRIVVIDNGMIQETGSHNELIAKNGLYARLVEMQFES